MKKPAKMKQARPTKRDLFSELRSPDDFQRMLGELAAAGRRMSESEVESLVAEAVAESRRKVRAARAGGNAKPRKR